MNAGFIRRGGQQAKHRALHQAEHLGRDLWRRHISRLNPLHGARLRARKMAVSILHADGQQGLRRARHSQLFKAWPGREGQAQRHAHAVNQLPGVQIARTGQQRQPLLPVHQQYFRCAA